MSELFMTAAWVVTLCVVVYYGVAEIVRLFAVQDRPPGRRDGTTMYFDVARLEREARISEQTRSHRHPLRRVR